MDEGLKKPESQRELKGLERISLSKELYPKKPILQPGNCSWGPYTRGHAETIQQPHTGQDSPHIKSLASLPAFLTSLALKRWFLTQVGFTFQEVWTVMLHRAPTSYTLRGEMITPSFFFLHTVHVSHLSSLILYFTCSPPRKQKRQKKATFQLCVGTFWERLSAPQSALTGRQWVSAPLWNATSSFWTTYAVTH